MGNAACNLALALVDGAHRRVAASVVEDHAHHGPGSRTRVTVTAAHPGVSDSWTLQMALLHGSAGVVSCTEDVVAAAGLVA